MSVIVKSLTIMASICVIIIIHYANTVNCNVSDKNLIYFWYRFEINQYIQITDVDSVSSIFLKLFPLIFPIRDSALFCYKMRHVRSDRLL